MKNSSVKGFTLVELLVVLVIIGAIIAIVLPGALTAIDTAKKKEAAATLRNIDSALMLCFASERTWANCDTFAKLVTPVTASVTTPYLESDPTANPPSFSSAAGANYAILTANVPYTSDKAMFPNWPNLN